MARRPRPDPKLEALRESGTLNPRPARVADETFRAGDFFDARDLVQVKYEMLRRVRVERTSVTRAAAVFGVSRPTFYQARAAFEQAGLGGLVLASPSSCAPGSQPGCRRAGTWLALPWLSARRAARRRRRSQGPSAPN